MSGGKMPAIKEWKALDPRCRAKLRRIITLLGDEGKVWNREHFSRERENLFAIKAFKVRIYCFFTRDKRIVLTNIDPAKKQDRADPRELDRAERIRSECINR